MVEIYDFAELSNKKQQEIAYLVSLATILDGKTKSPLLVEVSVEEILSTADARVALGSKDIFAGYVRAKQDILKNEAGKAFRQVGTLTVEREFRGNGVGVDLVRSMTQFVSENHVPFAFVNPDSKKTFTNAGYRLDEFGELPVDAVSKLDNEAMIYLDA